MIIGTDGIPIEKLTLRPDPNMEAVAAEHTTLLRASLAAAADTGLGALQELAITTERMTTLLVGDHPRVLPLRIPRAGSPDGPGALRPAPGGPRARARVRVIISLFETVRRTSQGGRVNLLDLKEILQILEEQDITEFELEQDGVKLRVCRGAGRSPALADGPVVVTHPRRRAGFRGPASRPRRQPRPPRPAAGTGSPPRTARS